jgi:hypothetical protein
MFEFRRESDPRNQLWEAHLGRLDRLYGGHAAGVASPSPRSSLGAVTADLRSAEWSARPLGRLGRPLLSEIERYLEFYAIARA